MGAIVQYSKEMNVRKWDFVIVDARQGGKYINQKSKYGIYIEATEKRQAEKSLLGSLLYQGEQVWIYSKDERGE